MKVALGILTAVLFLSPQDFEKQISDAYFKTIDSFLYLPRGCAVIFSEDGLALTNYHVISNLHEKLLAKDHKGNVHDAEVVSVDPLGDLALIKIKSDKKWRGIEIAQTNEYKPGAIVMTIGNPLNLASLSGKNQIAPIITTGRVCAITSISNYFDAVITDLLLNPGNSGGPLVTTRGKLAGICGKTFSRQGHETNTTLGIAISAAQIQKFLGIMMNNNIVYHCDLNGIKIEEVRTDDLSYVIVTQEKDPFRQGDIIASVNGRNVFTAAGLRNIVRSEPYTGSLEIGVIRESKRVGLSVQPEKLRPGAIGYKTYSGISVVNDGKTVVVEKVEAGSPAHYAMLNRGDQILEADGAEVLSAADFDNFVRAKYPGETIMLSMQKSGAADITKIRMILSIIGENQ